MADKSPSKIVTNPRIAKLIELEVAGRIKPEHQQELDTYRARGLAPKGGKGGTTESERKASAFLTRAIGANRSYEQTGVGPRGLIEQNVADALPNFANTTLNSNERQVADSAQDEFIAASLRQDSGAAIPQDEMERQRRIYFPMPGDGPDVIAQKRAARLRALDGLVQSAGGGVTKDQQAALEPLKAEITAAVSGETAPAKTLSQAEVEAEVGRMLIGGKPPAEIEAFLSAQGRPLNKDQRKALAANIGNPDPEVRTGGPVDLSGRGGPLAQVDAAIRGAADTVTFGTADEIAAGIDTFLPLSRLTGNDQVVSVWDGMSPQQAYSRNLELQRAVDAADERDRPVARFAGQFGGGLLGAGVAAARAPAIVGALGSGGRTARVAKGALAAAVGGGLYGGGSASEGERPQGALRGALIAPVAAGIGTAAAGALGRVLSPAVDPAVARLRAAGVALTPGQAMGGAWNRAEAKLQALPLVGDLIRSGRNRSVETFNRAAFDDALKHLDDALPEGVQGTRAQAYAQKAFDAAYEDARSGMRLIVDEQAKKDMADLAERVAGGALDEGDANRLMRIVRNKIDRRLNGAEGDGKTYKTIVSDLGDIARTNAVKNPEFAEAVTDLRHIVDSAARRVSAPEAVAKLAKADEGYAKLVRIEGAAARAGGDTGTFTPSQLSREVQKQSNTVRSREYLRGDALMQQLADDGLEVLPEKIADSGTPERLLMNAGALGGGAAVSPMGLAAYGALGVPYSPGVRDLAVKAIAGQRPALINDTGQFLQRNALTGALVAPIAISGLPRE